MSDKVQVIGSTQPVSKVCKSCGLSKDCGDYYKNRGGIHAVCKGCYRKRNKVYQKDYRAGIPITIRCRKLQQRAKDKGIPFDVTPDYLESIWTGVCPVFGSDVELNVDKGSHKAVEVDRIDPRKGYVKGNVAWLSARANRIKSDASLEELERIVEWLKSQ